jgi:capsular exopolysaccharide synthesis family protein
MSDSLLQIVWRQRLVVAGCIGACILAALAFLVLGTPKYTSTARIHVQRNGPQIIGQPRAEPSSDDPFIYTQREVVSSVPVLALAAADPNVIGLSVLRNVRDPIGYLKRNLDVEAGKKDELITLTFDAPDPAEANKVLAAIIKAYQAYSTDQRKQTASEVYSLLAAEKARATAEMAAKTQALAIQLRSGAMPAGGQDNAEFNLLVQRLGSLSQQLSDARKASLDAWAAREEVKRTILTVPAKAAAVAAYRKAGGAGDDPVRLRTELQQLRARLQVFSTRYGPEHNGIQALNREIEQVEIAYAAAVENHFEIAKALEAEAKNELDAMQTTANDQRARTAQVAWQQAETNVLQKHLDTIDARMKEVGLTEGGGAAHVNVLEAPHTDLQPSKPNRPRTLAIAAAIGLLLGVGIGCARDWYRFRLRSSAQAESALGLPVLATIPSMPQLETSPSGVRSIEGRAQPFAEVAAAYLALRRLAPADAPDAADRTILVTSATHGDGKSTVTANLAVFLAQLGRRVLLIDGDLRSMAHPAPFNVEAVAGGLTDVLAGTGEVANAIRASRIEGLEVFPCGGPTPNPETVFNNPRFAELLDELAEVYDHVLIDAPAMRAGSDARVMAAICDVTLLVMRDQPSNRRTAAAARDALQMVGANVGGVILNGVPRGQAEGSVPPSNGHGSHRPARMTAVRRKAALRGPVASEMASQA